MTKKVVVLVHGFFKGKQDMRFLEAGLVKAGFETIIVDLPTTFGSLDDCVKSLKFQLRQYSRNEYFCYVAHSMGGLIVRKYLSSCLEQQKGNVVFIATPHGGSGLAELAKTIPVYSRIFKPIKAFSYSSGYVKFKEERLFKVGIIAGLKNSAMSNISILKKPNDGRVEVENVKSSDADDFIVLPFDHGEIHHSRSTLLKVIDFLEGGEFGLKGRS